MVALLTDLSKDFDCLDHKLLIAKLNAYVFSLIALTLVHNTYQTEKNDSRVDSRSSIIQYFLTDLMVIIKDSDIAMLCRWQHTIL